MLKRKGKIDKKASVLDLLFIAIGLTVFAIMILISFKIYGDINNEFQNLAILPQESLDASDDILNTYTGPLDNSFLFLAVLLAMGSLILASMVRIHPIFIPFFILFYFGLVFFCGILSNIYQGIAEDPNFVVQAQQLTFVNNIITFLPFFIGIVGVLLMIVMYKTWSNNQLT